MQKSYTILNFFEKKSINIYHGMTFFLLAFSVFVVLTSVVETFYYHHSLPFYDHWRSVAEVRAWWSGKYSIYDLFFAPRLDHRVATAVLFYIMDYNFFQGKGIFLLSSTFALQFLHFVVLMILFRRASRISSIIPASLVIAMMFSMLQSDILLWSVAIMFPIVYFAASCAFLSYALTLERAAKGQSVVLPILSMITSMVIAAISMGVGPTVGIALLILSLLQRQSLRINLAIGLLTLAIFFCCLYGMDGKGIDKYTYVFFNPTVCIEFFFTFLGNPFVYISPFFLIKLFGFVGFLSCAYGCWLVWTRKVVKPAQLSLLGISIFCVVIAAFAAIGGRSTTGNILSAVSSRYVFSNLIFWSSQILFWMSLSFEGYREYVRKWVLVLICSCICGAIALEQFRMFSGIKLFPFGNSSRLVPLEGWQRKANFDASANAFISNVDDPDALNITMPLPVLWDFVRQSALTLKTHHSSIFSEPSAFWVGSKLSDVVVVSPNKSACQGLIESISPIVGSSTPEALKVNGWAWSNKEKAPISRILLVNQDNVIVGVGSGDGLKRVDIPQASKDVTSNFVGWQGYANLPAGGVLKAFGLINKGMEACSVGF